MQTSPSRLPLPCLLALAVGGFVAGLGCTSPQPTQEPEEAPTTQPSGPALSLLYTQADEGLMRFDARRDSAETLVQGATFGGVQAVSPSGRYVAFSYVAKDSSYLALLALSEGRALQTLHAADSSTTYSVAWHPEQDRLAFGHYQPAPNVTRGPGGIRTARPDGSTRDVGCRAAREVLHWLPDGDLATRDDDHLYLVAPSDCSLQDSLDARRMHDVEYAPNGQRMAYIHRELQYDRSTHEYVPDSSLILSGPRGEGSETLFGDKRAIRHLRWAPDGSELAFDMEVDTSGHRQIVVHDGERAFFVVPPEQTTADQVHPRWSPAGGRLAFTMRTADGPVAAVRVKRQTRRLGPVDGAVWGWLDDESVVVPGPDSLRVRTLDGQRRDVHPAPTTLIYVWRRPVS